MFLLKIAAKNIFRNKRRSALSVAAQAAAIACAIVVGGYYEYNFWGLRESSIRSQYGHVQIAKKGYWQRQNLDAKTFAIENCDEIIEMVENIEGVEAVSPRLQFTALLETKAGSSQNVIVRGIVPSRENDFNTFLSKKAGLSLRDGDFNKAELGATLAKNVSCEVDDGFFLDTIDADGFQSAMEFSAKSLVGSYSEQFDSKIVRIPIDASRSLSQVAGAHEIAVLAENTADTDKIRRRIEAALGEKADGLSITTWRDHATYYNQVVQFFGGFYRAVSLAVAVLAFLSAFSLAMLGASERRSEFATMRSLGASKGFVSRQIELESLVIAAASLVAGVAVAGAVSAAIHFAGGIRMPPPPGVSASYAVEIKWTVQNLALAAALEFSACLSAAAFISAQIRNATIVSGLSEK